MVIFHANSRHLLQFINKNYSGSTAMEILSHVHDINPCNIKYICVICVNEQHSYQKNGWRRMQYVVIPLIGFC
jgi:hypothetical protein